MFGNAKVSRTRANPLLFGAGALSLISLVFGILVIIGCTHNKAVLNSTYFLELNVTRVDISNGILGGLTEGLNGLTQDAEHDLGIHDFYRYGLWGYCDGYNTTVVFCSQPKPGNATNPIAALDADIKHNYNIQLPSGVQRDVNRLESLSTFIFACWIIGTVLDFGTMLSLLTGCRSRIGACVVGLFAACAFIFLLIGSILVQVLYQIMRDAINKAGDFGIVSLEASLGAQMFAFVWISCVSCGLAVILAASACCARTRR